MTDNIHLTFTWNELTSNWLVRSGNVILWAESLAVAARPGHALIAYADVHGPRRVIRFHVQEVAHPSQYTDQPYFTRVFDTLEILNGHITVDGQPWAE